MGFHVPNEFRVRSGKYASPNEYGNNGAFTIPFQQRQLDIIASDGEGWEHVSVSLMGRCPNWIEMCFIKDMFWDESDCVVQYHPPKSDYVNHHSYCLHLWRLIKGEVPRPASMLVGPKTEDADVQRD